MPLDQIKMIMNWERVHPITSLGDFQKRSLGNRRCYALFHPTMGQCPLATVYAALEWKQPKSIQNIFRTARRRTDVRKTKVVTFYSISVGIPGLHSVRLGRSLLDMVSTRLRYTLPHLHTISTLSPIVGFRGWAIRAGFTPEMLNNKLLARQLCIQYLQEVIQGKADIDDSVARFHYGNGATLADVFPNADISAKGREQSFGLMASYLYYSLHFGNQPQNNENKHQVIK